MAASCSLTQTEGEWDGKGDRVRDRLREGEKKKGGSETENVKTREGERGKTKGKEIEMAVLKKDEKMVCNEYRQR